MPPTHETKIDEPPRYKTGEELRQEAIDNLFGTNKGLTDKPTTPIQETEKCNHNFHCYLDICERCGMQRLSKGTLTTTPTQETWQEEFDKKFPRAVMNNHGGGIIFRSERENDRLKAFIQSLLQRKEREMVEASYELINESKDATDHHIKLCEALSTKNLLKVK